MTTNTCGQCRHYEVQRKTSYEMAPCATQKSKATVRPAHVVCPLGKFFPISVTANQKGNK